MKTTVRQVRRLVEDAMYGVPEYVLRETTRRYVEELKQQFVKHVFGTQPSEKDEREAFNELREVLAEFEKDVSEMLDEAVAEFLHRV